MRNNVLKLMVVLLVVVICQLSFVATAYAHVVVKPVQVGVGAFQTFTIGVPNEKEMPTVGVRLVVPAGLNYVTPNVKPGWNVEVVKSGEGENAKVKEIIWTGGIIPAGQRDDFNFSAQVPASPTSLFWKAYQTYQDGEVVNWDDKPGSEDAKPYSTTAVINDLAPAKEAPQNNSEVISFAALALAAAALVISIRRK